MRIVSLAREDLRLTLRDRSSIFWIFLAPFLWVYFFSFMARPQSPTGARIGLLVIQEDSSPRAERLVDLLRGENFNLTLVRPGETRPAGSDLPARSLTIPVGFSDSLARREKIQLDLREERRANPEGTFAVQVALHRATIRLLADEGLGPVDPVNDAVQVKSEWAGALRIPSGYYQTIPGNLVMFVLIATMTYGSALLALERQQGILRRLASSPLGRAELILGKFLGRATIATIQVAIFVLIGLTLFRIHWGRSPLGLVALLGSYIACTAALSLLSGALFTSPGVAAGIGIVLALTMSALGGCWWPAEIMPDWLQGVGHVFPTAWAMDGLHQILSWEGGLRDVLLPIGVLAAYAVGAGSLAVRFFRVSA